MFFEIVIFVVGQGICMCLVLFKVFYFIVGKLMFGYVIDCVCQLQLEWIYVVIGYGVDLVCEWMVVDDLNFVFQVEQFGMGYVVVQVLLFFSVDQVLIFYGDVLLIQLDILQCLLV